MVEIEDFYHYLIFLKIKMKIYQNNRYLIKRKFKMSEHDPSEDKIDLSNDICPNREQRANGTNVFFRKHLNS